MGQELKVWYDKEGDYLEVIFERKERYFREDLLPSKIDNTLKV